jgi:23S rRNA pseudouridine2605 synthase
MAMKPPGKRPPGTRPPGNRPPSIRTSGERPAGDRPQGSKPRSNRTAGDPRAARRATEDPRRERPDRDEAPARGPRQPPRSGRDAAPRRDDRPERPARTRDGAPGRARTTRARPAPSAAPEPVDTGALSGHAPQRIAKLLARAGIGSRRDIERMIAEGRIARDGEVIPSPALNITSLAGITLDGQPVAGVRAARLFRFHKPAGFLTTARDPGGRPTIMDILPPGLPRVVPVGRLDMNTEGLLLLTNDGGLKRALELPSSGVPRTYRVRAYGEISQRVLESLMEGITIEGIHYGSINANIERRTGRNLWLMMTLKEGKNREIRRVLEHLGLQVSRLIRTSYGPIPLADLPPRMADEIPADLVAQLKKQLAD